MAQWWDKKPRQPIVRRMDQARALTKMMAECSKVEFCLSKARAKLEKWGAEGIDEILQRLVAEKFIDEERFTSAFVRDRTRFYGWGPRKIEFALQRLGIDKELINKALEDEKDSSATTLETVLARKKKQLASASPRKVPAQGSSDYETRMSTLKQKQKDRAKLIRAALSKGFSYDEILKSID